MAEDKDEMAIDLLVLLQKLWTKKILVLKIAVVGLIIGVIIALSIPPKYTTVVTLTTESGKPTMGNMGALASMAGINLGSSSDGNLFSPDLYPDVLQSTPFVQSLLHVNVVDADQNINTTLSDYYQNNQKTAWWSYVLKSPGLLLKLFSSEEDTSRELEQNSRFIPSAEMIIINMCIASYSINTEKKSRITTLEVTTQSPVISAYLADTLIAYLQEYIIDQRTKKARIDLKNGEALHQQARTDYYNAQNKVASFADGNMDIRSAKYRINQEKLQNEANIAYAVYNQMAQQVQLSKIKVQDNTPVFTIIQPAIEPLFPSSPKKKLIVIALAFLAVVGACVWVLRKDIEGWL